MIKNSQISVAYIITHIGLIFFMYPTDVIENTKEAHWLPILVGFSLHVSLIFVYLKGLSYFDKGSIITILEKKKKILSWLLLFPVFLSLSGNIILTVRAYAEIISIVILASTPLWILMFSLLIIPSYMVLHGGLTGLFRTGILLGSMFALPMFFVIIASFQNIEIRYALPLLPSNSNVFSFLVDLTYYKSLFTFIAGFLFLGFIPSNVSFKPKTIYLGSLVLFPLFLLSVYVPILTLGEETASQLQFPFIFAIDTIEIDWLMFERVTVFLLLSLIAFSMLFIALTLWQIMCMIRFSVKNIHPTRPLPIIIFVILILMVFGFCLSIPDWKSIDYFVKWHTILRLYVSLATPCIIFFIGRTHANQMKRELKKR